MRFDPYQEVSASCCQTGGAALVRARKVSRKSGMRMFLRPSGITGLIGQVAGLSRRRRASRRRAAIVGAQRLQHTEELCDPETGAGDERAEELCLDHGRSIGMVPGV